MEKRAKPKRRKIGLEGRGGTETEERERRDGCREREVERKRGATKEVMEWL